MKSKMKKSLKTVKESRFDELSDRLEVYFNKYVPKSGPAGNMRGEAIRAVNRLAYDYFNNGWGNNNEGPINFLWRSGVTQYANQRFKDALNKVSQYAFNQFIDYDSGDNPAFEKSVNDLIENFLTFVDDIPDDPSDEDMFEYSEGEWERSESEYDYEEDDWEESFKPKRESKGKYRKSSIREDLEVTDQIYVVTNDETGEVLSDIITDKEEAVEVAQELADNLGVEVLVEAYLPKSQVNESILSPSYRYKGKRNSRYLNKYYNKGDDKRMYGKVRESIKRSTRKSTSKSLNQANRVKSIIESLKKFNNVNESADIKPIAVGNESIRSKLSKYVANSLSPHSSYQDVLEEINTVFSDAANRDYEFSAIAEMAYDLAYANDLDDISSDAFTESDFGIVLQVLNEIESHSSCTCVKEAKDHLMKLANSYFDQDDPHSLSDLHRNESKYGKKNRLSKRIRESRRVTKHRSRIYK